ncbi:hypothetical protein B5M09_003382, partial [Aphanomyces astaci]
MNKHTTAPSISSEDLLSKLEGVERRLHDVEANTEESRTREEMLTNKMGIVGELGDRVAQQDASIQDVKLSVGQMGIRLGDCVTTVAFELMKAALLNDVQNMLKDAIAQQAAMQDTRFNALQEQLLRLSGGDDDDDDDDSNDMDEEPTYGPGDVLRPAHVPPTETTMITQKKGKHDGSSTMRMMFDPAQKLLVEQLDQQLKQLATRVRDVEADRVTWHDQVAGIHNQVVQCNMDAGQFRHDMIGAFDDLAAKTKATPASDLATPAAIPPSRKYDDDIQRLSDRIERLTKQLGDLHLAHGSDHATTDATAVRFKTVQDDMRKLKAQVDAFQDNHSLMQGLMGGGSSDGASPDLSMVFGKLAEMRQTQANATDDLRRHLATLDGWVKELQTQRQQVKHSDESRARLNLRQLDADLELKKDALHHQLHLQEHLMGQVTDWLHAIPAIRKELEKPGTHSTRPVSRVCRCLTHEMWAADAHEHPKMAELQAMLRQYYRALPGVATLQASSHGLHGMLQQLHHTFLQTQDGAASATGVDDLTPREAQLQTLHTLLATLDKHNEGLVKQYDHARVQMDELWNVWQKRLRTDTDNRVTMLSKEITEVALLKPKMPSPPPATVVPPPHLDKKMSLSAQAMALGEGSDAVKRLEQLLLTCCRRLDGFEDDIRGLTRNVHAYRGDMTDRVTESHMSKLKVSSFFFQIFAELAKIHAVLGSSKFQGGATTAAKVYDDSDIKTTLDVQAELIASLCLELKKVHAEKSDDSEHKQLSAIPVEDAIESDKLFNAKLESITEKVAEMFVSLEVVQRSSSQPRNIIPAYNPTLLLEAFAQNIEAKLALTQDLTKKDIERIKMELGDNVRRRVTRAMEAMREQIPPSAEPTTSVGTIPGMEDDALDREGDAEF